MAASIPLVDFSKYLNGTQEEKTEVSNELIQKVKEYGFVYLTNYGISSEVVERMFSLSEEFFKKPIEIKQSVKKSLVTYCGYDAIGEEKLADDRPGDLKESYMIKKFDTPWPNDWNEFKEFMLDFHQQCNQLSAQILSSFAMGLNIDSNVFDKFKNGECTLLRLLHYPPLPEHIETNQIRAGEHTDYGALTLLFQDSVGGLEVKTANDEWIPALYHPNSILINVGDVLEMWTNGELRSTPHRVVNPNDDDRKHKPRYSTAYFTDPDLDEEIKCLDKFVSESNPAKYKPKLFRDHLHFKYYQTYEKK